GEAGGHGSAVADLGGEVVGEGGKGVVAEVAGEAADGSRVGPGDRLEIVVGIEAGPVAGAPADEAEAPLGLPGVVERAALVEDLAVHFEGDGLARVCCARGWGGGDGGADGLAQLGQGRLVAVEGEDPVAAAGVEGHLL